MTRQEGHQFRGAVASAVAISALLGALAAPPVQAIDWNDIQGTNAVLFYPGQSSWEWNLTPADHDGAEDIREGKRCWDCHEAEEELMGSRTVTGEKIEPDPIDGKQPVIDANIKAAHDDERLYIRLEWADPDGPVGRKLDKEYEAKATVMISDGSLISFRRGGCWASCHDDLDDMPSDAGNELSKYLAQSRSKMTRSGGGEQYKPEGELEELMAKGRFLEYWQARLNKDAAPEPLDGYILEKRHENENTMIALEGGYQNGRWEVVFSRALEQSGTGRIQIASGTEYMLGFAIHANFADGRRHHVSFRRTLVLDEGEADIVAVRR